MEIHPAKMHENGPQREHGRGLENENENESLLRYSSFLQKMSSSPFLPVQCSKLVGS